MATEFLFEAIHKYISPLLEMCGMYVDNRGEIVYRDSPEVSMKFVNQRYNGQADQSQFIIPVVPLSDQHYLDIKTDPDRDCYNPFVNRSHMLAICVQMIPALVPYYISDTKLALCGSEEDYNELGKEYIKIYNKTSENGEDIVGFSCIEDPSNPKILYEYKADDIIKAAWGVAVLAYKDINGRYPKEFEDIDKSWKKITALLNKWDKARKTISREIKEEKLENFDVNRMELTDNKLDVFEPYIYSMNQFVMGYDEAAKQDYLTSLFDKDSLKSVTDSSITPANMVSQCELYKLRDNNVPTFIINKPKVNEHAKEVVPIIPVPNVAKVQTPPVTNTTVEKPTSTQSSGFRIKHNSTGYAQPIPNQFGGYQQNTFGYNQYNIFNDPSKTNLNCMDLTNGEVVNPYRAYGVGI